MAKQAIRFIFVALLCVALPLGLHAETTTLLKLRNALQIECHQTLRFGSHVAGGSLQLSVSPQSEGAAVCTVRGCANARFKVWVAAGPVVLRRLGRGRPILMRGFRYGGALGALGIGRFNRRGELDNCRIGAQAFVSRKNLPGLYRGVATVRIIYL